MNTLQKSGGIAALLHGAVYMVSMALGIAIMFPLLEATPWPLSPTTRRWCTCGT